MEIYKKISPMNTKGEYHGYQEWYSNNGTRITLRCFMIHDFEIGYEEWHNHKATNYYIR